MPTKKNQLPDMFQYCVNYFRHVILQHEYSYYSYVLGEKCREVK